MSGLPVEGSVYNIVNTRNNLAASVATNGGQTLCGQPINTNGYYQGWMVHYTDKANLVCTVTEAQHQDSAGVRIIVPGKPVVPMDIKQQWTLKDLGQGFVTIGMPAIGGGFDYVWDLPEDCACAGKSVVINAPTIADTQSWSFQLAG